MLDNIILQTHQHKSRLHVFIAYLPIYDNHHNNAWGQNVVFALPSTSLHKLTATWNNCCLACGCRTLCLAPAKCACQWLGSTLRGACLVYVHARAHLLPLPFGVLGFAAQTTSKVLQKLWTSNKLSGFDSMRKSNKRGKVIMVPLLRI